MSNRLTHRQQNHLQALILFTSIALLLVVIGWLIAGVNGIIISLIFANLIIFTSPRLSPGIILYIYRAQLIPPDQGFDIYQIVNKLAAAYKLKHRPRLFYIPSMLMTAFTTGLREQTSIALSDAMLRKLTRRELEAVIAHEMAHIHNNDLLVMSIADILNRITSIMAMTGYLLILVYIPFFITSGQSIPWLLFLILIITPHISALLQLALSRTREFTADADAAYATGDPLALASALTKIEVYQHNWLERLFFPGKRTTAPSLLRTHPSTQERIENLNRLFTDMRQL